MAIREIDPGPPILTIRRPDGYVVKTDLTVLGPMLAYYRVRANLSLTALATLSLSTSSSTLKAIEAGLRGISTRSLAIRLGTALKLDPPELDHFLWVAGYAPVVDWQRFAREILTDLGLEHLYEEGSARLYLRVRRTPRGHDAT